MILPTVIIILAVLQMVLPLRWAFLPLLIAACHVGNQEVFWEFTSARLLIILGLGRLVLAQGFGFVKFATTDWIIVTFAVVTIVSSIGHQPNYTNPFVERLGLVINIAGAYFYFRGYLPDSLSFNRFPIALAWIMIPLALGIAAERVTGFNFYSVLGPHSGDAIVRDGEIRAVGPFRSPILTGTAGATALPLFLGLWPIRRKLAVVAATAGLVICFCSASSGPVAAAFFGVALALGWQFRRYSKFAVLIGVASIIPLSLWMGKPIWHIMARLDFTGSSTGWHRAHLMDQALKYIGEWWIFGTDYTRHWMATGVSWSADHSDITNYYLHLGVIGGILLPIILLLLIGSSVRRCYLRSMVGGNDSNYKQYFWWCAVAAILSHAISFLSISYFDQMYVIFYGLIASVAANDEEMHHPLEQPENDYECAFQNSASEPT
jgi:hypothetical protein